MNPHTPNTNPPSEEREKSAPASASAPGEDRSVWNVFGERIEDPCPECEGDGYVDINDLETGGVIGPMDCPTCHGRKTANRGQVT